MCSSSKISIEIEPPSLQLQKVLPLRLSNMLLRIELFVIGIFIFATIFSLLQTNRVYWSSTDKWLIILFMLCGFFIVIYLYTKNIISTRKRLIEIMIMYQAASTMVTLNIAIGIFHHIRLSIHTYSLFAV